MGMPASVAGDMSLGHVFSPSPITPSQSTVLAGNKPVHVAGDVIGIHVLGLSSHAGTISKTSTTVYANSKGVARLMDTGDCGALLLGTAGTVLVGG
jgi:uncharacterized Zn-binding protein involved in type VI secretion